MEIGSLPLPTIGKLPRSVGLLARQVVLRTWLKIATSTQHNLPFDLGFIQRYISLNYSYETK